MKKVGLLSIILLAFILSSAQQDEKAKNILAQVSENTRSFSSIQAEFTFTMDNNEIDIHEKNEGTIKIKGQKYSVDLPDLGMKIYSDGQTLWHYMKDGNQVTISDIDEENNDLMDPTSLFSIYEKGFDSKFISEEKEANKVLYLIELYPDDEALELSKVNIKIDKATMMIHSATLFDTDENLYGILVKKMGTDKSFPDSDFVFDASKYDDVEVIDFR